MPFNRVGKAVQIFVFDLVVPPPAMMISGSLHACVRGEKFQSTTRFVQSRDAAPAHCRVRSELESAPPRSQVEWHMAFLLSINVTNRSVDVDGDTPLPWVLRDALGMTGTKFGCGSQTGSSDTIAINQVRRP